MTSHDHLFVFTRCFVWSCMSWRLKPLWTIFLQTNFGWSKSQVVTWRDPRRTPGDLVANSLTGSGTLPLLYKVAELLTWHNAKKIQYTFGPLKKLNPSETIGLIDSPTIAKVFLMTTLFKSLRKGHVMYTYFPSFQNLFGVRLSSSIHLHIFTSDISVTVPESTPTKDKLHYLTWSSRWAKCRFSYLAAALGTNLHLREWI